MITGNIDNLDFEARAVFVKLGYSKTTIQPMISVTRNLMRLHIKKGEKNFNRKTAEEYVKCQEMRYQSGEIIKKTFVMYETTIKYLEQICATGTIMYNWRRHFPLLPNCFEEILSDILDNKEHNYKFNKKHHDFARRFFWWLCSQGYNDLTCVDEIIVREYIIDCSTRMTGVSLQGVRSSLKWLFMFLSADGTLTEAMSKLFLFSIPVHKTIKPFMPQDEIAAVLNVIDRSTAKGKRDYAMILLTAVTGLRGVDVVGLSFNSIDWCNGEIRLAQEKTNKAVALPLITCVGEAIHEYILNGRPDNNELDNVFLGVNAPFKSLTRSTLKHCLKDYCIKAGLTKKWSPHSLRRSIATNMVTSGVSVITVAQTLGIREINTTKQYISLDSKNLKECALDLNGILGGAVQ